MASDQEVDITTQQQDEKMKPREEDWNEDEEDWRISRHGHSLIAVTPQCWMSLSTRADWAAEKWRKLHYRDSDALQGAKHNNINMDRHLQTTTKLLDKQRRIMERQHTSLQRQLLTDSLRQKIHQEKGLTRTDSLKQQENVSIRSSKSRQLPGRQYQSSEDVRMWREKEREGEKEEKEGEGKKEEEKEGESPTSVAEFCRVTPLRERAHTVDNMYLHSQQLPSSQKTSLRSAQRPSSHLIHSSSSPTSSLHCLSSQRHSSPQSSSRPSSQRLPSRHPSSRLSSSPPPSQHWPDIEKKKKKLFVSKWASMTDLRDSRNSSANSTSSPEKERWLTDLESHLPPDLYAQSQAVQRMRKEYRLKRMLSRSHEECRSLGLEDRRFVNLTAVLVKQ